jgi:hypothetical protein
VEESGRGLFWDAPEGTEEKQRKSVLGMATLIKAGTSQT